LDSPKQLIEKTEDELIWRQEAEIFKNDDIPGYIITKNNAHLDPQKNIFYLILA